MNLFSNNVRSLIFQDRVNAHTQFSRHGHNRDPRAFAGSISTAHRAIKLSKLWILADRRPGRLNKLTSKPAVAAWVIDPRSDRIARGVLGRYQTQKATSCRTLSICRQSPMRAISWLATIQPILGCSSGTQWTATVCASSLQKRRISLVLLTTCFSENSKLSSN